MSDRLGLNFDLPVGLKIGNKHVRNVSLLETNSIGEEVFTRKLAQEPFTYIANVITIATDRIGDTAIGAYARERYFETQKVEIPQIVKNIPLADANTMLLEIHRRVWEHEFKDMPTRCAFCTKDITIDVDLNNIEHSEETNSFIEDAIEFDAITCPMEEFSIDELISTSRKEEVNSLVGTKWNRIMFRIPTLGDALKNQEFFDRSIEMWRNIGADCITAIQRVEKNEVGVDVVVETLGEDYVRLLGLKLYRYLSVKNLKQIRASLREDLPVLPFAYVDTCACDSQRKIPYAVESTNFFSESL